MPMAIELVHCSKAIEETLKMPVITLLLVAFLEHAMRMIQTVPTYLSAIAAE